MVSDTIGSPNDFGIAATWRGVLGAAAPRGVTCGRNRLVGGYADTAARRSLLRAARPESRRARLRDAALEKGAAAVVVERVRPQAREMPSWSRIRWLRLQNLADLGARPLGRHAWSG